QLPYVLGKAPLFIPLLVCVDEKDKLIVRELLTKAGDPLSISAGKLDQRITNSLKYCGTPSADICILENPQEMEEIFSNSALNLWKKSETETSDGQIFINRLDALF